MTRREKKAIREKYDVKNSMFEQDTSVPVYDSDLKVITVPALMLWFAFFCMSLIVRFVH